MEGNGVSQRLTARENCQQLAVVLRQVGAVELVFHEAGVLEVEVIKDGVLHAGNGQIAGEGLLPNPLGHPQPLHVRAQAAFEPGGVRFNLADPVPRGDHRQNRLIERPADNFNPPAADEPRQPVDVVAVMLVEPFHQRAAGVQRNPQLGGIAFQEVQKRQIAILIRLLEDPAEIADWLMVVQNQAKAKRIHGAVNVGAGRMLARSMCAAASVSSYYRQNRSAFPNEYIHQREVRSVSAAASGLTVLMKMPVLHSKPATFTRRGKISICQSY